MQPNWKTKGMDVPPTSLTNLEFVIVHFNYKRFPLDTHSLWRKPFYYLCYQKLSICGPSNKKIYYVFLGHHSFFSSSLNCSCHIFAPIGTFKTNKNKN